MSKIRVLSDHVANQIAAGEVVERPASVAKELVENSIDAGARRIEVDVEAGGRRLLRVSDDGEGMSRDDAVLAFERHATSKISGSADLERISTLGFRGEALASIASVARVELVTQRDDESEGTRVIIEGGRMRDVSPAARPRGTTISVRDLFFNVPARRKFLRSEATESFHLTNLITHYALAHPEISFTLTNNGREVLRAGEAADLRERAYQIFGAGFLENLLEVSGGHPSVARTRGFVSAPRERRTTRDAQFLFVNGRYVRDRLVTRALSEGYRAVLPRGTYPAALLFLEVPLEEVDVNVHPAKTEVRFRRAAAVAEAVREAVRGALASGGFLRSEENVEETVEDAPRAEPAPDAAWRAGDPYAELYDRAAARQESINFGRPADEGRDELPRSDESERAEPPAPPSFFDDEPRAPEIGAGEELRRDARAGPAPALTPPHAEAASAPPLPPLGSAAGLVREAAPETLAHNIRPLGQLADSYIVASDADGLLLIDQHAAHERVLFEKYRRAESGRAPESQNLLIPETFDLTPAQAAAFGDVSAELERYGFALMRLSGRTVAVRAVPADLPAGTVRTLLAELLEAAEPERRARARGELGERVAAALARHAAIKRNTPLTPEQTRWLVEQLIRTHSPTTSPNGRPVILRLTRRDLDRAFS